MQDERPVPETKKNIKPAPKPKQQKPVPVKTKPVPKPKPKQGVAQGKQKKKAKKGMSMGGVISILLIIVFVGLFAVVYLNIGGSKQKIASFLNVETSVTEQTAAINAVQEKLTTQQEDLDEQLRLVNLESKDLESKEEELDSKEKELNDKDEALTGAEAIAAKEKVELDATALIFEMMDAKLAANAISGLETSEEMAKILLNMNSEKAATILDKIKSDLATEILSEMISEQ